MKIALPDFSKASVLVVGDVMLDRYWFGDATRLSPEAPVPVVRVKQFDDRPGGAGNVALNIAALGAKVTLLGVTGKDEPANRLVEQLTQAKVTPQILQLEHLATITKLRVISRHQQLIRLDFEESFAAFNNELLVKKYEAALATAQVVILSDYGKGTITNAQQLIQLAKAKNIPVLVDPKGSDFSIYSHATTITPNLKEFEAVVGPCPNEQTVLQKAKALLTQYDISSLLLTRGELGMTLITNALNEELHLPAHAREVFDVTGAGDTVIAVLAAAIAAKESLPNAMAIANLAASLVVAKLGAAHVTVNELQVALNQNQAVQQGIVNEEQLITAVANAKQEGKRIVFTNGCFDVLHAGHVKYLQQAKQLGDYLIVAVNTDLSIQRLKGPGRPINTTEHRMALLASLGVVDWVIAFEDDTPNRLLQLLKPHVLAKGGDYTIDKVVGADIVLAYGGDIRVLGMVKGISSSTIIDRMVQSVKISESTTQEV